MSLNAKDVEQAEVAGSFFGESIRKPINISVFVFISIPNTEPSWIFMSMLVNAPVSYKVYIGISFIFFQNHIQSPTVHIMVLYL